MDLVYSVIVPVYNAEKYLGDCVQSVLAQTSDSAFEIILVNDGSKDGSAAICDRYAEEDSRIHVIHQENQGVSAARNAGIAAAKGQYVLFLDSDDLWTEDFLAAIEVYTAGQPDMIEFGSFTFSDSGLCKKNIPTCKAAGESGMDYLALHEKMGVMPMVTCWAAAFRRDFLDQHQLRFPVGVSYGEDFRFCMYCFQKAQSIHTIDRALYRYRVNETSVTRTPNVKKIRDVLLTCSEMYRLYPSKLLADYYCMSIWTIEGLKRADVPQLYDLLQENRDILKQVSGKRARLARSLYTLFGWYNGAKLLRMMASIRNLIRK